MDDIRQSELGIQLRDWFAGQALIGLAQGWDSAESTRSAVDIAIDAYVLADKMLAERMEQP